MKTREELETLVEPIRNDLTSGAAEIALRAISILRNMMAEQAGTGDLDQARAQLIETSKALVKAQPAMATVFHMCNTVLMAAEGARTIDELIGRCNEALENFEQRLCDSAARIAEHVDGLIEAGEWVFAYSFSSTVVSSLLNARSRGKLFRVVSTEARPSMEGRKLATVLAQSGVEVMHTFDTAMQLILPQCRVAFMGCDCIARPGIVNKAGSWLLALACRELSIPLYALAGTEKFVTVERLFEFEDHERPGAEVWIDPPAGVRVLNRQFDLIPFEWLAGLVTEHGILKTEKDVERYVSSTAVHESIRLSALV